MFGTARANIDYRILLIGQADDDDTFARPFEWFAQNCPVTIPLSQIFGALGGDFYRNLTIDSRPIRS